ncbi:MAG: hypothetical protein WD063_08540 [Pirellulales bacterium]
MTVNLKAEFGHSYIVKLEPGSLFERGDELRMFIPCEAGSIRACGRRKLAAITDNDLVAKQLAKLPGVRRFDAETYTFAVDDFDSVAELMEPRCRD